MLSISEFQAFVRQERPRADFFRQGRKGLVVIVGWWDGCGVVDLAGGTRRPDQARWVQPRDVTELRAAFVDWGLLSDVVWPVGESESDGPRSRPRGPEYWMADFFAALREGRSVQRACEDVKIARSWVYRLRRGDRTFRRMWDAAALRPDEDT
jgi:hypothetical protein